MREEQIEQHIENAINSITPDLLEKVSNAPVEKLQELSQVYKSKNYKSGKKTKLLYGMATVCAACFIAVIGIYMTKGKVSTTIDIDVNPSVEITADKSDRVIDVIPLNADGKTIIDNMNMKNVDLNVAVNAIIGSMVKYGYFHEAKNAVLISVENKDKTKAEQIRKYVTEDISVSLSKSNIKATIYNHEISNDKSLKDISKKYGISMGKASFLNKLMKQSNHLSYEKLVSLSMEELTDLIIQENINLKGLIEYEEDESLRENIEEALEDAEEDYEVENDIDDKKKEEDDSEEDDSYSDDLEDDSEDDD